jgi:hypothetical protein
MKKVKAIVPKTWPAPKIEGFKISLCGQDFVIPALTLGQVEKFDETIRTVDGIQGDRMPDKIRAAMPLMLAAFRRNYPEMTEAELSEMIDLNTFRIVLAAIAGATGYTKAAPGETTPAA